MDRWIAGNRFGLSLRTDRPACPRTEYYQSWFYQVDFCPEHIHSKGPLGSSRVRHNCYWDNGWDNDCSVCPWRIPGVKLASSVGLVCRVVDCYHHLLVHGVCLHPCSFFSVRFIFTLLCTQLSAVPYTSHVIFASPVFQVIFETYQFIQVSP